MGLHARHPASRWLWIYALAALVLLGAGIGPFRADTAWAEGTGAAADACANAPAPSTSSASASAASSAAAQSLSDAVRIPRDEAPHHDPDEWWYNVGHLSGVDAAGNQHCYGFEQVTFQLLDQAPVPLYVGHFAITDLARGTFQYAARTDSYPVPDTPNQYALRTGDWTMSGGSGKANLHATLPDYGMDLQLQTTKPAAPHGDHGTIPYGPLGTSKYYSWTSLQASGTIVDHGVAVKVTGLSWADRQWGAFDFATGAGWDWFSVQLTDGRQYMLYFVRDGDGVIVETIGTLIDRFGRTTNLTPAQLTDAATGSWTSPTTGITYGSGWKVNVPGGQLTMTPDLVNQELDLLDTAGVVYWEGSVSVGGQINGSPVTGVGYTEINPPVPS